MVVLRSLGGIQFRCLDALIQTGVRSNEIMGTRRGELDLDAGCGACQRGA
jgi:integrase